MSDNTVTPERLVSYLRTRRHDAANVCIVIEDGTDRRTWLDKIIKLLDAEEGFKLWYSLSEAKLAVQWTAVSPEQKVRVFSSYRKACEAAFDTVALGG